MKPTAQDVLEAVEFYDTKPETAHYRVAITTAIQAGLITAEDPSYRTKEETLTLAREAALGAGARPRRTSASKGLRLQDYLQREYDLVFEEAIKHRRVRDRPLDTLTKVRQWAEDAAASAFVEGYNWDSTEITCPYISTLEQKCKGSGLNHFDIKVLFNPCYMAYLKLLTLGYSAQHPVFPDQAGRDVEHTFHGARWST
jgi:hypothetical protein